MNRYILIHRLVGPSILLLLGVVALLHQAHLVRWGIFVPLLLILIGVLKLAERAALAANPYPADPYPGTPYPGAAGPNAAASQPYQQPPSTSPAPAETHDFGHGPDGGLL